VACSNLLPEEFITQAIYYPGNLLSRQGLLVAIYQTIGIDVGMDESYAVV
jgi:hypothetical protein